MRPNTSNKESILAITLLLLLLFVFFRSISFIYVALLLIVVSLLFEQAATLFHRGWTFITHILGLVSSTIILSVIFYLIIFPWSLMLKLFRKEILLLNTKGRSTTFINRNKLFTNNDLQNPY